jgi:hypothetical protein
MNQSQAFTSADQPIKYGIAQWSDSESQKRIFVTKWCYVTHFKE